MYSEEETELLIREYSAAQDKKAIIEELVKKLGRSKKSIIGKLSKEGVYEKQAYVSKTGEPPVTKLQLVADIASSLEVPPQQLEGLDKAPKLVLKRLLTCLNSSA